MADTTVTQTRSLDVPADFSYFHKRTELINARNAETDPTRRAVIQTKINALNAAEEAERDGDKERAAKLWEKVNAA